MKKILIFILLATVAATSMMAGGRREWVAKMRQTRHDFIIEKINVTGEQKKEFLQLYEAMEDEIYTAHKSARDMAKEVASKSNATDADYQRAAEALSNVKFREGQIEKTYLEKFGKILSKKQLFLLKQAEAEFTRNMVTKNKSK